MKIRWLGHSAFMLEGRKKILIDPFISGNPLSPVKVEELNPDLIIVTHGHGDHIGDSIEIAKRTGCKVLSILEVSKFLLAKGANAVEMNIGGTATVDGISVTMTPAMHSSSIYDNGVSVPGGCPVGVVVELDGIRVYHTGDTGLFSDMELLGELYKPQVMLVPIGSWYTMGITEAVKALEFVRPKMAIPMHYNTFPVIRQDPEEFKTLAGQKLPEVEVVIPEIGESMEYLEK